MKICYKCKTEKSLECFSKNSSRPDGRSSQCKKCHAILRREHYIKNRPKIRKQVDDWRKGYQMWFYSMKNTPCKDCGKSYPYYCMDFDHINKNKEFNVSSAFRNGWSKERIMREMEKCELVCAICHRIRTHNKLNELNASVV